MPDFHQTARMPGFAHTENSLRKRVPNEERGPGKLGQLNQLNKLSKWLLSIMLPFEFRSVIQIGTEVNQAYCCNKE